VTIQLGHLARNVLIIVKEKKERREIRSVVMSERIDVDGYTDSLTWNQK
jgi:hypothetical protein